MIRNGKQRAPREQSAPLCAHRGKPMQIGIVLVSYIQKARAARARQARPVCLQRALFGELP